MLRPKKRCKHCNKWFRPFYPNESYCNSCKKKVGKAKLYRKHQNKWRWKKVKNNRNQFKVFETYYIYYKGEIINIDALTTQVAAYKVHFFRLYPFVSIFLQVTQYIMVIWLVLQEGATWVWLLLILFPFTFVGAWIFDKKKLFPAEQSYLFRNTPEHMEVLEILRRLDKRE